MKIMIASDIHGSARYCRELIDAYEREGADRLLLLGDILYHGPRNQLPDEYDPPKVAAMLNEIKNDIICVRGNCDSEVDGMVLDFPITAESVILFAGDMLVYATHGHHCGENNPPPHGEGDILLTGHTHVPKCVDHGSYIYMNPGSVSIPKEDSPRGYMIMSDTSFVWKTLDGNEYMTYALAGAKK